MKQKKEIELPKKSLFPDLPDPSGRRKKCREPLNGDPFHDTANSVRAQRKRRKQLFY
jgi:hypothetical protein